MSSDGPIYRLARCSPEGVVWQLKRNCSMAPRQLWLAYAGLAGLSLTVAGWFWYLGAVVVLPFAALELLALAVAFAWYGRHATDQERIRVEPRRVVLECERAGVWTRQEWARQQVRVQPHREPTGLVELTAGGQRVQVGRFTPPAWRTQLARELRCALATV